MEDLDCGVNLKAFGFDDAEGRHMYFSLYGDLFDF